MRTAKRTALLSVYDKRGCAEFARELISLNFKIIASGGTAKYLKDVGIPVEDVADLVGGAALLGHRVVTLSREVHAGLLAKDNQEDRSELEHLKIPFIDLVCCDLYPLEEEVNNPVATQESVIEKTDIGGPTILRSAGKGRRIVICDVNDRSKVLEWLRSGEKNKEEFINKLCAKAEETVARYASLSAEYHSTGGYKNIFGKRMKECIYGENTWQTPAFLYRTHVGKNDSLAIHNWQLMAGSPMSYNNICDLDRMIQTITHIGAGFEKNFGSVPEIAIGVKHGNACGAGVGEKAVSKMLQGDLRAIFGGSVMLNFPVDKKAAEGLVHKFMPEGEKRLLDVVAASSFTLEAIEILSRKKGKCRLLANPLIQRAGLASLDSDLRFRYVRGGFLTQPNYTFVPDLKSQQGESLLNLQDIILAWAVGATSNSNTITIVKDSRLYGNGVGQQDRVGAAKLAIARADDAAKFASDQQQNFSRFTRQNPTGSDTTQNFAADLQNATAYSDSFFPFPDAVEVLIARGIKNIFSTSGSVNDNKIIELCKAKNVNLIMLPDSEARGFYQH